MTITFLSSLIKKIRNIIDDSSSKKFCNDVKQLCRLCNGTTEPFQAAYDKFWYKCPNCNFLQAGVTKSILAKLNRGEGFSAGTGTGGGGYREYWISELLRKELGLSRVLLYGTGNTPTFQRLYNEGVDVLGCDVSSDLITARKSEYKERFFSANEFPQVRFDAIVAVEVFEHLLKPMEVIKLFTSHLAEGGVIAGTTDFYQGGDISNHIYIKSELHIAYWSRMSLETASKVIDRRVRLFELECPGSVVPDEKFGLLWPRKRVFFYISRKATEFLYEIG